MLNVFFSISLLFCSWEIGNVLLCVSDPGPGARPVPDRALTRGLAQGE